MKMKSYRQSICWHT